MGEFSVSLFMEIYTFKMDKVVMAVKRSVDVSGKLYVWVEELLKKVQFEDFLWTEKDFCKETYRAYIIGKTFLSPRNFIY